MKDTIFNSFKVEGYLYQAELEIKQVTRQDSPNFGKNYITGTLHVATDEEGLNVVPIHYGYISEMTSKGAPSKSYETLKRIMEHGVAWVNSFSTVGKAGLTRLRCTPELALNDFYNRDGQLVSALRPEGGYVNILGATEEFSSERNRFDVDMYITSIVHQEADPDTNKAEKVLLKGAIFSTYRKELLPVTFDVTSEGGMNYFDGVDVVSSPVFTKVWGSMLCNTVTVERVEESAFGEASVHSYSKKTKSFVVTGTAVVPYDFGDPACLTAEEITKAQQARETKLADLKRRSDERGNAIPASQAAPTPMAINNAAFNF